MNRTLSADEVKALTPKQLAAAFCYHCQRMGSFGYYYRAELEYAAEDPAGVVVFYEGSTGKLRAYHKRGH